MSGSPTKVEEDEEGAGSPPTARKTVETDLYSNQETRRFLSLHTRKMSH